MQTVQEVITKTPLQAKLAPEDGHQLTPQQLSR